MTKRFALDDTLPDPYFTVDTGGGAALAVQVSRMESGLMMLEVSRNEVIFCRMFGEVIRIADEDRCNRSSARRADAQQEREK